MTPVLIHYKDNKKDNGLNLRMTLRSLDRFMPEAGEVVIVGDTHDWLSNTTHIPYKNPHRSNKDVNIIMACVKGATYLLEQGYKGDVIVAADDCVLLSPYVPALYFNEPAYQFMNEFPDRFKGSDWWKFPYNSIVHCMTMGWVADNCEAHVPQLLSIGSIFTLLDTRLGESLISPYTIMANAERSLGGRQAENVQPHRVNPEDLVVDMAGPHGPRFCNWNPKERTLAFKFMLNKIFPEPSRYENHGI